MLNFSELLIPPISYRALCNKSSVSVSVGRSVLSLKQNTATEETDLEPSKCYSHFMTYYLIASDT